MSFYPTQEDINHLFQSEKIVYAKVELLNKNFMIVDSLEGVLVSDQYNIDSTSNIRRTYHCELHVTNSSFYVGNDKRIWFDKFLRPYVGFYSLRKKEIIWYLKGTYIFNTASYSYSAEDRKLSLECNDLMSMLTGDRNGKQTGLSFTIPVGEDIRTSLIGIIKVFGLTKYRIDDLQRTVQHDLEFNANTDAYSMIEQLMEFVPNYEWFFDLDGTFVVQRLPCYTNDINILDDTVLSQLVIEEEYNIDFSAKNCIEVWGKSFDEKTVDRYTQECIYQDNIYKVTFEELTELTEYMVIGIKIPESNLENFSLAINDIGTFQVKDDYERTIKAGLFKADTDYIFMYKDSCMYFLGSFNIHAVYKNEDVSSPFSINNMGAEVWEIMSNGEYDNINSDLLAQERAMYECYYKAGLNDSLSLTLVNIPWLDVNQKISYTLKNTEETERWMIVSISGETLSGTCNVTLTKFHPDWSEIFNTNFIRKE